MNVKLFELRRAFLMALVEKINRIDSKNTDDEEVIALTKMYEKMTLEEKNILFDGIYGTVIETVESIADCEQVKILL